MNRPEKTLKIRKADPSGSKKIYYTWCFFFSKSKMIFCTTSGKMITKSSQKSTKNHNKILKPYKIPIIIKIICLQDFVLQNHVNLGDMFPLVFCAIFIRHRLRSNFHATTFLSANIRLQVRMCWITFLLKCCNWTWRQIWRHCFDKQLDR